MYLDQWKALSSCIRGLMQAGKLHASYLSINSSDSYGSGKRLREHGERVLSAIESFRAQFQQALSPVAIASIDNLIDNASKLIRDPSGSSNSRQERVWAALVQFVAFEAEMSFILSDFQDSIRARSELAFSHLQRLIVADSIFREKWKDAFKKGEVECEKLGAVHLLHHGIWAFKVNAKGARTDLVFQEPAGDLIDEQRYVDGFVLTEWKKASSVEKAEELFEAARLQAARYAEGVLFGSELTSYRYIVVVSANQVKIPNDLRKDSIVYRHINIAVEPKVPSAN